MLTVFGNTYLSTSAGSANSCSRPSKLKVAVAADAVGLVRLAGESLEGVMPLSGSDMETLTVGGALGEPAAKLLPPAPAAVQTAGPGGGAQDGAVLHF
jgi:hypothetical protein